MRLDYTLMRGDDKMIDLDLVDPATQTGYNLAGAAIAVTVENLFAKSVGDGIVVDESSGSVTVSIDPVDTQSAPDYRPSYRYDVQVTTAAGDVTTPQYGRILILPDVTT